MSAVVSTGARSGTMLPPWAAEWRRLRRSGCDVLGLSDMYHLVGSGLAFEDASPEPS